MFIITLRGVLVLGNTKWERISYFFSPSLSYLDHGIKNNYDKNQISLINQIGLYGILIYSSDNIKSLKLLF